MGNCCKKNAEQAGSRKKSRVEPKKKLKTAASKHIQLQQTEQEPFPLDVSKLESLNNNADLCRRIPTKNIDANKRAEIARQRVDRKARQSEFNSIALSNIQEEGLSNYNRFGSEGLIKVRNAKLVFKLDKSFDESQSFVLPRIKSISKQDTKKRGSLEDSTNEISMFKPHTSIHQEVPSLSESEDRGSNDIGHLIGEYMTSPAMKLLIAINELRTNPLGFSRKLASVLIRLTQTCDGDVPKMDIYRAMIAKFKAMAPLKTVQAVVQLSVDSYLHSEYLAKEQCLSSNGKMNSSTIERISKHGSLNGGKVYECYLQVSPFQADKIVLDLVMSMYNQNSNGNTRIIGDVEALLDPEVRYVGIGVAQQDQEEIYDIYANDIKDYKDCIITLTFVTEQYRPIDINFNQNLLATSGLIDFRKH
jgi:hypothetical protein